MSDDFPTLPDILNDNAGVVGAAAGLAVSRSVQATNRSIRNLQDQLGSVQKELAKSRSKDELEEWHREKLYRLSVEIREAAGQPVTRASLVNVAALAYRFQKTIPGTSAFRSFQDKEFLQSTESQVINLWTTSCASVNSGLDDLKELCAWHKFDCFLRSLLAVEESKVQLAEELEAAAHDRDVASSAKKQVWPDAIRGKHLISSLCLYGAVISFLFGLIALASGYGKPDSAHVSLAGIALIIVVAPMLLIILGLRGNDYDSRIWNIEIAKTKLEARLKALQQQEDSLRKETLSLATHVPSELLDYFCSPSHGLDERGQKRLEIAAYAHSLADGFGVDSEALPTGLVEWLQRQTSGALRRDFNDSEITDEQILESLAKAWEISPLQISPGSLLERDLGWYPEIVMAGLEHDFDVEIHPEVIAGVETVRDAIEATQAALAKKRSQSKA